jgi:hypothetical protein
MAALAGLAVLLAAAGRAAAQEGPAGRDDAGAPAPAIEIDLTVIGFDIAPGSPEERSLRDMAAAGGGLYLPVAPGAGGTLADAILAGAGVFPPPPPVAPPGGDGTAAGGGPVAVAEVEPNGRRAAATPVPPTAALSGTIAPRGDRDGYRLTVAGHGQLDLRLTRSPATLGIFFEVTDLDGRRVGGPFLPAKDGEPHEGQVDLPEPGTYFIQLGDRNDRGESPEPYALELAFAPSPDRLEPNPSAAKASPVPETATVLATILPRGDRDCYRLEVERAGELRVEVVDPPPNLEIWFEVLDGNLARIAGPFLPARRGFENVGAADLPEPGTYFLQLGDRNDADRSVAPYRLELRFAPSPDIFEPNPTLGKARPIHATGSLRATILPRGDRDLYRVDVARHGELEVRIVPPKNLEVWLEVWNEEVQRIAGPFLPARRGYENFASIDLPEPGTYFLKLGDRNDAERAVEPYALESTFRPSPDGHEPNPDGASAAKVSLGEAVRGAILPRGDRDWYRVEVAAAGKLAVSVTAAPKGMTLRVDLRDEAGRRIAGPVAASRAGAGLSVEAALPAAGRYLIQVGAKNDAERAIEPYDLTATFAPVP